MSGIGGYAADGVAALTCFALAIFAPSAGHAASPPSPDKCASMVEHWEKNYSFDEVSGCKPWRKARANGLYATLRRCEIRTKSEVGECGDETEAYSAFLTDSEIVENPPFGFNPHKAFSSSPTQSASSSQIEQKDEADRRAKRRQQIIDSFAQGTYTPASSNAQ